MADPNIMAIDISDPKQERIDELERAIDRIHEIASAPSVFSYHKTDEIAKIAKEARA